MSKTVLAKQCRVTPQTVVRWAARGCPHTRDARGVYTFDLKKVTRWRAKAMPTRAVLSPSYSDARTRRETASAGLRELQLKQKTGELVERAAVSKQAFETGRIVRDTLLLIPDRLAGILAAELDQHKIHGILTRELTQALEALAHG